MNTKQLISSPLIAFASALVACTPSIAEAFEGRCQDLIRKEGNEFEVVSFNSFYALKRAGGKPVKCRKDDSSNTWSCGNLKFSSTWRRIYDKSGNPWPVSWSFYNRETVCHRQEGGRYLQKVSHRSKGYSKAANLQLEMNEGSEEIFQEIRPNF